MALLERVKWAALGQLGAGAALGFAKFVQTLADQGETIVKQHETIRMLRETLGRQGQVITLQTETIMKQDQGIKKQDQVIGKLMAETIRLQRGDLERLQKQCSPPPTPTAPAPPTRSS